MQSFAHQLLAIQAPLPVATTTTATAPTSSRPTTAPNPHHHPNQSSHPTATTGGSRPRSASHSAPRPPTSARALFPPSGPASSPPDHYSGPDDHLDATVANAGGSTSHIPCKFFRQGTCAAGEKCSFSHSLDSTAVVPICKHWAKGNCKFGARCALAH
ncbi:hypothetical protein BC828DRAFT_350107, partial [Blastocladiella britannica]